MTLLFLSSSSSSLQRDTFTKKEGLFICSYPDTDRYCRYTGNDAETHINAHIHTSRLQRKRLTGLGFFFLSKPELVCVSWRRYPVGILIEA